MKANRTLMIALAVAAGWAALWMARPTGVLQAHPTPTRVNPLTELGVEPLAFHGIYECPRGAQYAAYAEGMTYYPPNHPLRPRLIVEPARCFPSPVEAELAGYSLAPPPAGIVAVEGFYLAPIDATLARQCREAAHDLGFEVPCPSYLPTPGFGIDPPSCGLPTYEMDSHGCVVGDFFVLSYQSFDAPPGYSQLRDITHGSHLSIAAFPTRATRPLLTDGSGLLLCPRAYRRGDLQTDGDALVHGELADYLECGEAPGNFFGLNTLNLGHVVLMWSRDEITYEVSVHGHSDMNRELARYIADSMEYVAPGG